jgi:peptidyl-prolyl cis-trans isomerase D
MLTFFRRGITAKLMLVLLGLVLVAIVITGFGAGGMGLDTLKNIGGGGIATVDGEHITSEEVGTQMSQVLDNARRQQPEIDMATIVRQGAVDDIVDQFITATGAVHFAQDHGLGATREMVDRYITTIPLFQDATGKFDDALFRRWLGEQKLSEAQVRKDITRQLLMRQLIDPAAAVARLPIGLVNQYAAMALESRTGSFGIVPAKAMITGVAPTDAELAAAYRTNVARYTIPERRVLRYALFDAAQVAAQSKATEAEIQAAYKQNAGEYAAREMRSLQQVVLQSEAAARSFAQKLAAGTSFEAAAQQAGYSPGDIAIGEQSRDAFAKISSPAVATAAFAAAKGATTQPIRSSFGWHIVRVADIKQIPGKPIEAVRAQVATAIEQRKSQEALSDFAAHIEDAVGGGASFDEVVRANKLSVVETPPLTGAGNAPDQPGWTQPPEIKALLGSGFALAPGDDPTVETVVQNQRFALLSVARVVPAAAPPLAQIKDRVRADLIVQRASARAHAVATAIVAKINAGIAPGQAFAEAKLNLPPVQTITTTRQQIASRPNGVPAYITTLFTMPRGKAKLSPAPNGEGWIIVFLNGITPGDPAKSPEAVQKLRGELGQALTQEYSSQFGNSILAGMKVKRNEKAIADLKAQLSRGSAQ